MNYSISDLGPYNPLFREAPGLILDTIDKAIFRFVWDEYVGRVRSGKIPLFPIKLRDVERKTGIDRHTIADHLGSLNKMGLIIKDGDNYSVNGDYFLSLLKLGHSLTSQEDKKALRIAIAAGDKGKLKELGFEYLEGITSLLNQMSGRVISYPSGYDSTQVGNILPKWVRFYPSGGNNTQLGAIYTSWVDKIRAYVCENYKMEDVIAVFEQKIGYDSTQLGIITPTYEIFSKSKSLGEEAIAVLQIFAGSLLVHFGYDSTQQVGKILPKGGYDSTHSKKKEKESVAKNVGEAELPYNKGVIESEDEFVDEREETPSYHQIQNKERYEARIRNNSLPYFNFQEISNILSSFNIASEREDKLFIFILWHNIQEDYFMIEDEDGNETPSNMDGKKLDDLEFRREVENALEETNEAIEEGRYNFNGQELPVNLEKKLEAEAVDTIIDFAHEKVDGDVRWILSQDRFRDMYGKPVEQTHRKRASRSQDDGDREKKKEYFRQLVLSYYDDRYDSLSDIEAAITQFAQMFLEIDQKTGEIMGISQENELAERRYLSSTEYKGFLITLRDEKGIHITSEDFEGVLNQMRVDHNENLEHVSEVMFSMFSYEKIQAWIQKHGVQSPINV